MTAPARARGYHAGAALGRPEAEARFPWLRAVDWPRVAARFPVRLLRDYLGDASSPADPRVLTAMPSNDELRDDPGDIPDPVGEQGRSPMPWVVRKHDNRVLLLLTKRCHLYCRYCFRRDHVPGEGEDPTAAEWGDMLHYAKHSGARELILSGGDPLAVTDARLFAAIDAVRPEVPVVRLHTRAPITFPQRVTSALVAGLRRRAPVWVLVHANHPVELSAPVREALARLVDAGLPVLNQAVLLRGVNDSASTLAELCEALVELRVFPYYLHHPDAVPGNAAFRLSTAEGWAIYEELRGKLSGIALPQYVID
ncbi:MAG: KamA family radical SAM protein, partial [Deltaproteobacteria bacterium]|nr:KamA family radical SAM protein [Deltaproteobacteria bacterium]